MIKAKEESWGAFLLELLVLVLIALFIRFYVFQFFRVSGPSMCPTLNELEEGCLDSKGEFIFVNELLYQLREPRRGEIVVFRPPNKQVYYVKRVMAVAGDRIDVKNGEVYFSNESQGLEQERLKESYLSEKNQGQTTSSQETFEIPKGYFLLFGDNRLKSLDARQCFVRGGCESGIATPYVPIKNIVGRAEFVVWPVWMMRDLDNDPFELYEKSERK
ncbi:MAG TPA: signal peptidase I [Candidatus Gracilibacteria bacterium]